MKYTILTFLSMALLLCCKPSKEKFQNIDNAYFVIDSLDAGYYTIDMGEDNYPLFVFFHEPDTLNFKFENSLLSQLNLVRYQPKDLNSLEKEFGNDKKRAMNSELDVDKRLFASKEYLAVGHTEDYPYSQPIIKYARDTAFKDLKGIVGTLSYKYKSNKAKKTYNVVVDQYILEENGNTWRMGIIKTDYKGLTSTDSLFALILNSLSLNHL